MVSDEIVYAEVFEILSCMKKEEVMKIPVELLEFFRKERSKTYRTRIDRNDLFNPDNITQRTVNLLGWLIIDYMANEEEKAELIRNARENDRRREIEKKAKYSSEVFVKKEPKENVILETIEDTVEDVQLTVVNKDNSFFVIIKKFIKNLLKIKD